jgi:hypothetical protein
MKNEWEGDHTVGHMNRNIRVTKQREVAVMLAYSSFGALQPNVHESMWHLQHEHALQEGASGVARLQYVVAEGHRFG